MNEQMVELITRRRRQILVHSFLYYQQNESIIADHVFDKWSKELVELQEKFPEEAKQAPFHEGFKTFDGSSGFDLPYSDPQIQNTGLHLLRIHRQRRKQHETE